MSSAERRIVNATDRPSTIASLAAGLRAAGLEEGQTVLVHSSLSSLGWVVGGPVAVIEALLLVLGDAGTLVMPAHSGENSDPSAWSDPPVPRDWWQIIRDQMPPYEARKTPTRGMGAIAELFRSWPGSVRSDHPTLSFSASGPRAEFVTRDHELSGGLGENSPLGRLYELDAQVLLMGVDHDSNTSLHLAEQRADYPGKRWEETGSAISLDGRRQWVEYRQLDGDSDDFILLGRDFEARGRVRAGQVGMANTLLMRQRELVDFGTEWLEENRE